MHAIQELEELEAKFMEIKMVEFAAGKDATDVLSRDEQLFLEAFPTKLRNARSEASRWKRRLDTLTQYDIRFFQDPFKDEQRKIEDMLRL